MPTKKWTAVWQDDQRLVVGKVEVGDDIKDICDFRDAAMKVDAFETYLKPHAGKLKIYVKSGQESRELDMTDDVSTLENSGNHGTNPILIVLPSATGELSI
jgi:hypothetical protein